MAWRRVMTKALELEQRAHGRLECRLQAGAVPNQFGFWDTGQVAAPAALTRTVL